VSLFRELSEKVAASASHRVPRSFGRGKLGAAVLLLGYTALAGGCITEEREQQIGDTMASEVNPHLPILQDPMLSAYVTEVGDRLVEVSERPDLNYRFYIIDTDVVNAFALPGGHVYLTRGLIERAQNGTEFAGVLAHEIGHVAARHGVQKLQRHLRTGSLVNVLYNTILGGEPELLRENSVQLANVIWTAGHSRRDEEEADRLAVRYLLRTGTEPDGVVTLLQTLLDEESQDIGEAGRLETWFSTHPLTATRIRDAQENIDRMSDEEEQVTELDLDPFPAFKQMVTQTMPVAGEDHR
jgi:beta-barrel assembly-enhancing protease